jgi:hypothetical protein
MKNAIVLAFDEVIGKDTLFEGNFLNKSILETNEIMEFIKKNNTYTSIVNKELFNEMMEVVNKTINPINWDTLSEENFYILGGWEQHAIFMFYEKNNNELYDFGVINAGEGCNIHGIDGELTNGILIFRDIKLENINDFRIKYLKFFNCKNKNFVKKDFLVISYYIILVTSLLPGLLESSFNTINFDNLEKEKKIIRLKINTQIMGSCAFTNHINYICYLLYKKGHTNDYNENFNEWYAKCKNLMKKNIYLEIITEKDYTKYNWYKYILDTYENESENENNKIYPDIDYENGLIDNIDFKKKELNKKKFTVYKKNLLDKKKIFEEAGGISTQNKHGFEEIPIALYNFNYGDFYNKNIDIGINDLRYVLYYYDIGFGGQCTIIPLLNMYKLKKLFIDKKNEWDNFIDNNTKRYIYDILYGRDTEIVKNALYRVNSIELSFVFLLIMIFNILKFDRGEEYYNDKDFSEKNFKIYSKEILELIPVGNKNLLETINELVSEIETVINYFPNIDDNDDIISYPTKIKSQGLLIHPERFLDKIIFHSNFEVIDIKENKHKYNFILDTLLNENDFENFSEKMMSSNSNYIIFESCNNTALYSCNNIPTESININLHNYFCRYSIFENKVNIFINKIKEILESNDLTNIKYYIIYFYLCELKGTRIENNIFNKYNDIALNFLKKMYKNLDFEIRSKKNCIVNTYLFRYNQCIDIEKHLIELSYKVMIPKTEKKYFGLLKYSFIFELIDGETIKIYDCKSESLIDFYIIEYDKNIKILLYKNEQNTIKSVKELLNIFKNTGGNNLFVYIALNFYHKDNIWYDRNDINIKLEYDKNNMSKIFYTYNGIKYTVIIDLDGDIPKKYIDFFNIMMNNDDALLLYKDDNNNYYLKSYSYSLEFKLYNEKIYYNHDQIDYELSYMSEPYLYNNFSIFKLTDQTKNKTKFMLFYNYTNIVDNFDKIKPGSFVNISSLGFDIYKKDELMYKHNINSKNNNFMNNYYTIVDSFDNNLILKDKNDMMALLSSCIIYNTPELILKTIKQIQTILLSNDFDMKFIKTLIGLSHDIYSFPIFELIFREKKFKEYNYLYMSKLMKKYNYNFKIKKITSKYIEIISLVYKNGNFIKLFENNDSKYSLDCNFESLRKQFKIQYRLGNTIYNEFIIKTIKIFTEIHNISFYEINYFENKNYSNKNLIKKFSLLLKNNIGSGINQVVLDLNIKKTLELFDYLVLKDKEYLYPIQELIMGCY